jgi:hypothetical protein
MQGSKADIMNDKKPQPDEVGKAVEKQHLRRLSLTNASLHQVTSRPLVSEHGPLVGTLRTDGVAAQSPSIPPFLVHVLPSPRRHLRPRRRPQVPKMEFRFSRQRMIRNKEKWRRILTIEPLYTASLDSIYTVENTATSKQHSQLLTTATTGYSD